MPAPAPRTKPRQLENPKVIHGAARTHGRRTIHLRYPSPKKAADGRAKADGVSGGTAHQLPQTRKESRHGEAPSPGAGRSPTHKPKSKLAKDLFLATEGYLDCRKAI